MVIVVVGRSAVSVVCSAGGIELSLSLTTGASGQYGLACGVGCRWCWLWLK